ncbi:uncharacterized protein VP01_177g11 [Puccinia sorghi]|uniref:Uncharacterized protein n=1 Tax=Puccinia sorghi TaxID=27349 RepID=A0A0L6VF90_9BASI|nr:uncharacterized protein VP01_177g11 [Puccinia sorghi]
MTPSPFDSTCLFFFFYFLFTATNFWTHKTTAEIPTPAPPANKQPSISWDEDSQNGGESSMTIHLNQLTAASNYQKWRGDKENGTTKKSICSEIPNETQGLKFQSNLTTSIFPNKLKH